jgi:kumamolisin
VGPLWAGLIALINQSVGKHAGLINPALYANPGALTDIVSGNNNGYRCGPGWNPVTGLGTPKGSAVLAAVKGNGRASV